MSKHHFHKKAGVTIEAVNEEGFVIGEAREILFTDYTDTAAEDGVFGRISFRSNLAVADKVDSISLYGINKEDEPFSWVIEEVMLSDEPEGPEKNHYAFYGESLNMLFLFDEV